MGSGLGPSGSTLSAAHREIREFDSIPIADSLLIHRWSLMFRWMDDLWLVYLRSLPPRIKARIDRFRETFFYGQDLELKVTSDNVAFGFQFQVHSGQVKVAQHLKFRQNFDSTKPSPGGALIQPPQSFLPDSARRGVMLGYFFRVLDRTNHDCKGVATQLRRVLNEFLIADYSPTEPRKVWKVVRRTARLPLPDMRKVFKQPPRAAALDALWDDFLFELEKEHGSQVPAVSCLLDHL